MLSSFELLNQLSELVDVVFNGKAFAKTNYLAKYMTMEDEPYFMLYLGHNETVFPLLQALDNLQSLLINPAEAVFFEFYS